MTSNTSKIITKPPNRGFQVRKPTKTTVEQEQALRDQLHLEIENKTKACSNLSYDCTLPRLNGYEFCLRHILQDPVAPYKQCAFVYSGNGKRCLQPAPKNDLKKDVGFTNFCFEHSRFAQLVKTRNSIGKFKEAETTETILNNLTHHIKIDKTAAKTSPDDIEVDTCSLSLNPFVDIDCAAIIDTGRNILDYASDSSSDEDPVTIGNSWKGCEMENSDNESVDSQNEDLLKHAGIYTTEEATMITKEKLIRLQALYIEQFQRLQHVLKERRRKYVHSLRRERETLCSIHNQTKDSAKERRLYNKLKALNQYHRKNGNEAILHKKYIEKRAKVTAGLVNKQPFYSKCMFTEGGVKCGERTLPCCKFCKKHIQEDKKQILFRSCGVEKSGVTCQEPVTNIFEDSTCYLHIQIPPPKTYTQKKYESDTDEDELQLPQQSLMSKLDDESSFTTMQDNQNMELGPEVEIFSTNDNDTTMDIKLQISEDEEEKIEDLKKNNELIFDIEIEV